MKNQTSIVKFEMGSKGPIAIGYTAQGNAISGYYIQTIINSKLVSHKGTSSSNYKKRFAKLPSKFLD